MADNKNDPFKTPGWHSPILHPAAEGDAFDAPPPMVPGGPIPTNGTGFENVSKPGGPGYLPTK